MKILTISDRLKAIADCIGFGETMADIGTDHGQLPVYLKLQDYCPKVIMTDVNSGPLETAKETIAQHYPSAEFDIRQGDGLTVLEPGEVDAVVIAGMGGILIKDILDHDMDKTGSFRRLILQPRNNAYVIRDWLNKNNYSIVDEKLVKEGDQICEVIVAVPPGKESDEELLAARAASNMEYLFACNYQMLMEFPPMLFAKNDPLLYDFLDNKHSAQVDIINEIQEKGISEESHETLRYAIYRVRMIESMYGILAEGL